MRLRRRALEHLRTRCVDGLRVELRELSGLVDGHTAHVAVSPVRVAIPHLPRVGLFRRGVLGPTLDDRNVGCPTMYGPCCHNCGQEGEVEEY